MPKRNRELLLKTAAHIEEVPESYAQYTFYSESDKAPCGTRACLAGEIVICSAPTIEKGVKKLKAQIQRAMDSSEYIKTGESAARLAGFGVEEARALFAADAVMWPRRFRNLYYNAKSERGRAKAAAALLRYLADGGEVA